MPSGVVLRASARLKTRPDTEGIETSTLLAPDSPFPPV